MVFYKRLPHRRLFWLSLIIVGTLIFIGFRLFQSKPAQGTFCPYCSACIHPQGPIVIAYLSLSQLPSFLPWAQYWQKDSRFEAVMIVPYEGLAVEEYYQQVRKSHIPNLYVLSSLDSSPYGLYPMARSPAVYVINLSDPAVGPVYRFDQV